jgi:hypothetical protein
MIEEKKQYCSGSSNERYDGDIFDSIEDSAIDTIKDLEIGDDFYIGEVRKIKIEDLVSGSNLIDEIAERAMEEVGEVADDYLSDANAEELEKHICDWFKEKGLEPGFYAVDNEKHFEKTGDNTYEEIPNGKACL